ncbi:hypothetical protein EX30DRAFT_161539 [Ascodesmis nigricans]|uniref:Uncharacterized protein n=1 Tax=Ascodesmis nigricans TaxID=341454 RepID=A0A4S2MMR7_9PEZI|nr:hypothetical protein EX30DRAFT_161539 [Ascodesmis nigricans]
MGLLSSFFLFFFLGFIWNRITVVVIVVSITFVVAGFKGFILCCDYLPLFFGLIFGAALHSGSMHQFRLLSFVSSVTFLLPSTFYPLLSLFSTLHFPFFPSLPFFFFCFKFLLLSCLLSCLRAIRLLLRFRFFPLVCRFSCGAMLPASLFNHPLLIVHHRLAHRRWFVRLFSYIVDVASAEISWLFKVKVVFILKFKLGLGLGLGFSRQCLACE